MPKKYTPSQMARIERLAAEYYLKGDSQVVIADKIKIQREPISQPTVSRVLATLRKQWLESSLVDLGERKAMELEKVDQLEAEYWAAWKRSLRKRGTTTEEGLVKGGALTTDKLAKIKVVSSESDGNPIFLTGVDRCIVRRCAILGLEAPKKIAGFEAGSKMTWLEFISGSKAEDEN